MSIVGASRHNPINVRQMDTQLYNNAAQLGNWNVIEQFESQFESQQTSEGNGIPHKLSKHISHCY